MSGFRSHEARQELGRHKADQESGSHRSKNQEWRDHRHPGSERLADRNADQPLHVGCGAECNQSDYSDNCIDRRKRPDTRWSADQLTSVSKLQCSAGMELAGGVCFQGSAREPEEWFGAFSTCAESKLRLPTAGELVMFEHRLQSEPEQEWTEPQYPSSVAQIAAADQGGLALSFESTGAKEPFRCVTLASNRRSF